ncbi:succinyldiaminopimelate desuccinylase [Parasphingorhabdus marina DSM 22363]|uniref:Succinyl-diaminopimelate desuccinylase n=1 Tax=Parasphingorhabdus marina DSM 22363 TaxID=1123272 RepID=A0A1N6CNK1_9SPHN|nr:succinyl-diaminopimelate desuccinylase [Parasphingorhabdus marina]SIN59944.1 succinyldiaminopimelate desuccinylase [Parasphingorhabdus marina DSM 22363]
MTDTSPVKLAKSLIACPSITPATGSVFETCESMLEPLGFEVSRFVAGDAPEQADLGGAVENLFAIRRGADDSRHFAFAGHLDVVPPGEGWHSDPFAPEIRGDLLYGRGAVDMKGSIAAFVSALHQLPRDLGTISLIITGDEEGPARFGTVALMDWMAERNIRPDLCVVGEPTSVHRLGDMVKIGRRGSVNMWVTVNGTQGHVAYPHLADNPITRLGKILSEIDELHLDGGTDWFQASNIEFTDLHVGNPAHNVIPARAEGRLSIRFNDQHSGDSLSQMIREIVEKHGGKLRPVISGEPFLTPPGELSELVATAITDVTGVEPELSTSGGTSDARFLSKIVPVVEFGLCNATMHKLDEAVAIADLDQLAEIYALIVRRALG